MNTAHLRSLDLNLLPVLEALLEERSVTRAAARLALTQSAVSHALNRLRHALDDELFVRGPSGMQPTPRALEIGAGVQRAVAQLRSALEPARFDPRETDARFTLGGSGYASSILLPKVLARLAVQAPGAELRVRQSPGTAAEDLDSGRIDLVIGAFSRVPERFWFEPLFSDRMVWALRAGHPAAADGSLTLQTLAALPQLVLASAEEEQVVSGSVVAHGLERRVIWDDGGVLQAELDARGLKRTIALTLPDAHAALAVAARSDLAVLAPQRLAESLAQAWGLRLFPPPYPSTAVEIGALWRKDLDSPARAWFRSLLSEAAAALPTLDGRETLAHPEGGR